MRRSTSSSLVRAFSDMTPPKPLEPQHQLYANLMDEARMRIHAMRDVIFDRENWLPRLLQEFCYLQLRILCEQIAVGCLIAHGEVINRRTLGNWNIPEVMKRLWQLNADFYPKGIRIQISESGMHLDEYAVPQLSKDELIALWRRSGDYLHRGTALKVLKEDPSGPVVAIDEIIAWGQKITNLLDQHIISSSDKLKHLVIALGGEGGASIWVAETQSPT